MINTENGNYLSFFIKNLPGVDFVKDEGMKNVFFSRKFENLLKKSLKKNSLLNSIKEISKEDLGTLKLKKGEYILSEEKIQICKEKCTYLILRFPIVIEEIKYIVGIVMEITHIKEEENLRQSFKELLEIYKELIETEERIRKKYIEFEKKHCSIIKSKEMYKLALLALNKGIYDWNIEKNSVFYSYDFLTKLPDRRFFEEKLNKSLKEKEKGIVLLIDLDNFKNINDTLGHDVGDELLKIIANKLKDNIEEKDTVSRFAGDGFLIIKPNIQSYKEAQESANKIINIFNDIWKIKKHKIYITVSIGITSYPDDGKDVNVILRNVDTAVYDVKSSGKNNYKFFQKSMYDEVLRKTEIEKALREAIKNKEFELYYQPQVDVKTGRIVTLEALIRWNNPRFGMVSPMEFIPIAEETGFIIEIGKWVLKTACRQNKKWKDKGYIYDTIAVNVSSVQLNQIDFVHFIKDMLKKEKLEAKFLEIEITESVLMKSLKESIKILEDLRKMGVKVALDDFGTGYSSLNYLMKIPIDTLKLDKSFIDNIMTNNTQKSVIEGIILIAHEIKLDVVAEGVEEKEQLKILANKKCDKIQGYFFSKPYNAKVIEENLKKGFFPINSV